MGFGSWCHERWVMMLRTKPQCLPMLTRKSSNLQNPPKISIRDQSKYGDTLASLLCVATLCYSVACGVLLVFFEAVEPASTTTFVISLLVAGITCISGGSCLSEYFSSEARSVYSCCYQRSGEILAFFFGWSWILSQASLTAAACKAVADRIDSLSGHALNSYLSEGNWSDALTTSLPVITVFSIASTGLSEISSWHAIFGPLTFFLAAAVSSLAFVTREPAWVPFADFNLKNVGDLNQILLLSSLSVLFFSGPQNILRQPIRTSGKTYTTSTLVHLNFVCLLLSITFLCSPTPHQLSTEIIRTICLILLGIESLFPLYAVFEDMASDGLLFRGLAKKWRPCCLPVTSPVIQFISFISVGLLALFLPFKILLLQSVVFQLFVNSVVPFLVLVRRYRDISSWQYEPMNHTSDRRISQDRSKRKKQETQYTKLQDLDTFEERSTTCIAEGPSDDSSDTDIDSVVQQYKDQARIANLKNLDGPTKLENVPEPTPSSSVRAMACVGALLALSVIMSTTLNFAGANDRFSVMVVVLICIFFSAIVHLLLLCLPQNRVSRTSSDDKTGCCSKVPNMPWGPGVATLLSNTLLVHCMIHVWKVYTSWILVGFLIYFIYGMNNSTAANSFYNMRPAHIALRPLPSYGNNCVPQILPSHRKLVRKPSKFRKGLI
ncbi:cationic amino acid transporter 2-like [Uloborus diversus]|uniref:cationic amino acid transporter 2-like n=1 Tax=Uloborus diversus TaxID=327109 RepID=UPI002409F31F|nr:cationic amino acid transporter 2-like [Uloborus diversus]